MKRIPILASLVLFTSMTSITPSANAAPIYTFPIKGCSYTYVRSHHNYPATDILAKRGCLFVAPTSGVIDEVNRVDRFKWATNKGADRGGLSISMIGDDGVRYYGSHLSFINPEMITGYRVSVGDTLGKVGDSGDAKGTGTHVHFGISWQTPAGIWWVRRGELYPWKYLDAWKAGKDANPYGAVKALEKKIGTVPKQVGY